MAEAIRVTCQITKAYVNPKQILTEVLRDYLKEHEWPRGLKLAAGVVAAKTPIVETKETVAARRGKLASIDKLDPTPSSAGRTAASRPSPTWGT